MAAEPAKKTAAKKTTRKPRENGLVKPDPQAKKTVRRPAKKTVVPEPEPDPTSFVQARIGKRTYPLLFDPRCRVCRHPKRALVEEEILLGTQYIAIARRMSERKNRKLDGTEETWPELTSDHISAHFNNDHSPLDAYTMRALHEQMVDVGEYANVGTRIISGLGLAKRIIGDVEKGIVTGELVPTIKEGIAAARIDVAIEQIKAQADGNDAQDQSWYYEQSLEIFFDKARENMSKDQYTKFINDIRIDPILDSLQKRRDQALRENA